MSTQEQMIPVKRDYKSRMFKLIFNDKRKLMEACKDLCDYAEYTYRVRKYAESMSVEEAVDKTIKECIQEDILKEFLMKHRAEARAMSIYEYNEEEHMRMEREDAFEDGKIEGREEGLASAAGSILV